MPQKENWKKALWLYWYFLRIGSYTFGGGWSMIAQMQKDFVQKRQWITDKELLDKISVGRSVPGTMISNVTLLFGYSMGGIPGAFASVLGIITMPVLVLTVLTFCYTQMRDNLYVARALVGVRAAVVPIMLITSTKMIKSALVNWPCYLVTVLAFVLCTFTSINNALVVVLGAVCGLIIALGQSRAKKGGSLQ